MVRLLHPHKDRFWRAKFVSDWQRKSQRLGIVMAGCLCFWTILLLIFVG